MPRAFGPVLALTLVFLLVGRAGYCEQTVRQGVLGRGESWETPWRIIDSGVAGPSVLIVGGVHGNEPAGSRAARQIAHWPIARGKLIVLPQLNRLGLRANTRWSPIHRNDKKLRDLNRNFPQTNDDAEQPRTALCQATWEFVREQQPDWVFDLHEGFDFHCLNAKSVGSSVISFPANTAFAKKLVETANEWTTDGYSFDLLAKKGPVLGSLARACGERLGAKSFILETTFKAQPVSLRTRQHRAMVSTALLSIGSIDSDCTNLVAPADPSSTTRVGLFDDAGANEKSLLAAIELSPSTHVVHIGARDMTDEVLRQLDVLVFPGGSGSKQGQAMGAQGRAAVRRFSERGGGVVGVCAGAYLCSSHYSWSLHLMNAACFNKTVEIPGKGRKSMWYRGRGKPVRFESNATGKALLGLAANGKVHYANGPILSPGSNPEAPAYRPLAFFREEVVLYEPQRGSMMNAPAVVTSDFGKGRVLAISPHFEMTEGMSPVIHRAIDYVRGE